MKKFISGIVAAAGLALALACGGSGSSSSGTASIAGAIDTGVVGTDVSSLSVVAVETGNTAIKTKGTITAASASGEDHTFVVGNLKSGTEYSIIVNRVIDNDPFTDTEVELMSSVVTADATTGTLSKGLGKTKRKRQINMATTFCSKKYRKARASGASTTLASIVTETFGSSVTDLSSIVSDGGSLSIAGSTTAVTIVDTTAAVAVQQMTFATVAAVSMSASAVSAQASSLASLTESLATATAATLGNIVAAQAATFASIISNAGSSFSTLAQSADKEAANAVLSSGGSTDFASAIATVAADTGKIITAAVATITVKAVVASISLPTTFYSAISTIASATTSVTINATTITSTATTVATSVATSSGLTTDQITTVTNTVSSGGTNQSTSKEVGISSFDVAHATYGMKSSANFTLYSLAPVFKVVLTSAMSGKALNDMLTLKITGASGQQTVSTTNAVEASADGLTYYIMVKNAAAVAPSTNELKPGVSYTYALSANTGYTLASGTTTSGTITVADVTFTLPFDGSTYNQSQVAVNATYTGIDKTKSVMFNVNSSTALTSTSTSPLYGLDSLVSLKLNNNTVGTNGTNFSIDSTSITSTGFNVTLNANVLGSATYDVTVTKSGAAANLSSASTVSVTGR